MRRLAACLSGGPAAGAAVHRGARPCPQGGHLARWCAPGGRYRQQLCAALAPHRGRRHGRDGDPPHCSCQTGPVVSPLHTHTGSHVHNNCTARFQPAPCTDVALRKSHNHQIVHPLSGVAADLVVPRLGDGRHDGARRLGQRRQPLGVPVSHHLADVGRLRVDHPPPGHQLRLAGRPATAARAAFLRQLPKRAQRR